MKKNGMFIGFSVIAIAALSIHLDLNSAETEFETYLRELKQARDRRQEAIPSFAAPTSTTSSTTTTTCTGAYLMKINNSCYTASELFSGPVSKFENMMRAKEKLPFPSPAVAPGMAQFKLERVADKKFLIVIQTPQDTCPRYTILPSSQRPLKSMVYTYQTGVATLTTTDGSTEYPLFEVYPEFIYCLEVEERLGEKPNLKPVSCQEVLKGTISMQASD